MKNILKLLLLLSLFATAACSSNSSSDAKDGEEVVEEDADFLVDSDEEELVADEEGEEEEGDEEEVSEVAESDLEESDEEVASAPVMSGEHGQYTVQRGETLMLIAFKLYGDYTKWRSIAALNPGYESMIPVGTVLKYDKPTDHPKSIKH